MAHDQNIRDEILESDHRHYLISASAGSGKTTMLVDKSFTIIERKLIKPYQQIAMITFTRLATRQIKEKVIEKMEGIEDRNDYLKRIKIITTESFILSEVIKPFLRDAFGSEFPGGDNFIQNYNNNYKFRDLNEGLMQIKTQNIIGSFYDSNKNFTYQLGLEVFKRSVNAQKYFKARFPVLMIDEYQDVDNDMHQLYIFLKDTLRLRLVVVGDIKQLLYSFRGASSEIMESLMNDDELQKYHLTENFRSHLSIVNYSYHFFDGIDTPIIPYNENRIRFYSKTDIIENIDSFLNEVSFKEEDTFAYLFARRNQWDDERVWWEDKGFIFIDKTPLDSAYPNFDVLEPILKLYFNPGHYNVFNMLDDLNIDLKASTINKAELLRKKLSDNLTEVLKIVEEITGRTILDEEKGKFSDTLDKKYKVNFLLNKPKRLALTIHGAKGLEFDHVFINADSFFDYYGNFTKQTHYVAITRPKKSLHIVKNKRYESVLSGLGINISNNVYT